MATRAEYQSSWSRSEPSRRTSGYASQDATSGSSTGGSSSIGQAMNSMITAPFWMTAAGINMMTSGMQAIGQSMGAGTQGSGTQSTGAGNTSSTSGYGSDSSSTRVQGSSSSSTGSSSNRSSSSWTDWANPANWTSALSRQGGQSYDQDLSGDDLKYVSWTIIFTKPGFEAVLEPMHYDLVNYSTDSSSYAAMKIAKFLDRARFGKVEKPHSWVEHEYPSTRRFDVKVESKGGDGSKEGSKSETKIEAKEETSASKAEKNGWRIPGDDNKYVQFLYRVEWRLQKQQEEATRVERVTVERTSVS